MTMTLASLQQEQRETEASAEYIFEQKLLELDERIDRLNKVLDRIHKHDKTNPIPRLAPVSRRLCWQCRMRGGA